MLQKLRRAGEALVVTVPEALAEENGLRDGSEVELSVDGKNVTLSPPRKRYELAELLSEMPEASLPRVEGWDDMVPVGKESA
jgi:antitoxin ChpS